MIVAHQTVLIGPHEGKELALMLAGEKKVALFEQGMLPDDFLPYLEQQKFHAIRFYPIPKLDYCGWIVYESNSHNDALRLQDLIVASVGKGFLAEREREIGRILGYSEAAIDAYIEKMSAK
ncbi:MAG: hypothetical protein Q4E16_03510 [Neisseria sp.]|nr:hypothetical protein [Neisseria sp.]